MNMSFDDSPYDDLVRTSLDNRVIQRLHDSAGRHLTLASNGTGKGKDDGELELQDIMNTSEPDLAVTSDMSGSLNSSIAMDVDASMSDSSRMSSSSASRQSIRRMKKKKNKYRKMLGSTSSTSSNKPKRKKRYLLGASEQEEQEEEDVEDPLQATTDPSSVIQDESFQTARTSTSDATTTRQQTEGTVVADEKKDGEPEESAMTTSQTEPDASKSDKQKQADAIFNETFNRSVAALESNKSKQLLDTMAAIAKEAPSSSTSCKSGSCGKSSCSKGAQQPRTRRDPVRKRSILQRAVSDLGHRLGGNTDGSPQQQEQKGQRLARASSLKRLSSERRQKIKETFSTLGGSASSASISSPLPARVPRRRNNGPKVKLPNAQVASRLQGTRLAKVAAAAGVHSKRDEDDSSSSDSDSDSEDETPAVRASTGTMGGSQKNTGKRRVPPRRSSSMDANSLSAQVMAAAASYSTSTSTVSKRRGSFQATNRRPMPPRSKSLGSKKLAAAARQQSDDDTDVDDAGSNNRRGSFQRQQGRPMPPRSKSLGSKKLAAAARQESEDDTDGDGSNRRGSFQRRGRPMPSRSNSMGAKRLGATQRPAPAAHRKPRPPPRSTLPPASGQPPMKWEACCAAGAPRRPRAPPRNNLPPAHHQQQRRRSSSVDDSDRLIETAARGHGRFQNHQHHSRGSGLPPRSKSESATAVAAKGKEGSPFFDWEKYAAGSCGCGKGHD